jgi:AcrR family transcriptional regulator
MKSRATPARRMGVEDSKTRQRLVEEALKLIVKEGCAAVTARRLSEKLGLKRQIIHYYFNDIEDLLVAAIRHHSGRFRERVDALLAASEPLRVIWESNSTIAVPVLEFTVMAVRSRVIRDELCKHIAEMRKTEAIAVSRYLQARGITPVIDPALVTALVSGISHMLAQRRALGITEGYPEMVELMDRWMTSYETHGAIPG